MLIFFKVIRMSKQMVIGTSIAVAVFASIYGYVKYDQVYPSTDNAYVGAKYVNVAPKVDGYIQEVLINNNQKVNANDTLFKILPTDYNLATKQASKGYDSQLAQVEAAKKQLEIQSSVIKNDQNQLKYATEQYERISALYKENTVSEQSLQQIRTSFNSAQTQLEVDTKKLAQDQQMYNLALAKASQASVGVDLAKSNLGYTSYQAPFSGIVTNLNNLTTGELVAAGQPLFVLVDTSNWWVDANFKETQLDRIKVGQKVAVSLDMYDHKYDGVVQSISPASGNTFSLLPAQNATGNWVKVTQRFTVRIKLNDDQQYPLRINASAKVVVDTRN